jgi:hypothetical protein
MIQNLIIDDTLKKNTLSQPFDGCNEMQYTCNILPGFNYDANKMTVFQYEKRIIFVAIMNIHTHAFVIV